jgi:glutamine cyclotransferase
MAIASLVLWAFAVVPGPIAARNTHTPSEPVTGLDWQVVSARAHDPAAWTQGLQLDAVGRLYESTGLRGRSTLREVDAESGVVRRQVSLPDEHFGEGLALVEDRLIQLTWQEGVAHVWDAATFAPLETFAYEGEGWGLCFDGQRLVMSDGSQRLTFRDADTFAITGSVEVDGAGLPAMRFNELECVDGLVWANAWLTDTIVRIDPIAGRVTGVLDMEGVLDQWPEAIDHGADAPPDVLNGIAWDAAAGTFLVTGKLWPALFEIRVDDAGADPSPTG